MEPEQREPSGDGVRAEGVPPTASSTSSRSVARGTVWAVAAASIPPLYTFVTSVVAARVLGISGLGRLSYIAFVSATLVMILVAGLPRALMRYIGEALGNDTAGRIRPLVRSITIPVSVAAFVGFAICTGIGLLGAEPKYAWFFAGIACGGAILHTIPSCVLVGIHRWRDAFIVGISTGGLAMIAKIVVLSEGGGITSVLAVDAVTVTINVIGTVYLARRAARRLLPPDEPLGDLPRQVWRFGAIASIAVVINYVVFRRTEIFFLEHFSTDTQIALYSVPFSLVEVIVFMPRYVGQVVAPSVATLFGAGDMRRIGLGYGLAVRVVLPIGFFAAAAAAALGPTFITAVYGPQFDEAGRVLVILVLTLPLVPLMTLSSSVLLGIGRQWVPTAILAAAAVVNLSLDFLLIPRYDAIGAAIANSGAQIVGSVPLAVYTAACIGSVSMGVGRMARAALAALVAGLAALLMVLVFPDWVALVLGGVMFLIVAFVGSLLLRIVDKDDTAWLAALFPSRIVKTVARFARLLRLPSPLAR